MSLCGMTPSQILFAINIYACVITAVIVFLMQQWHYKHESKEAYERGHKDGVELGKLTKENWHMTLPEYPEVEAQFDEKHRKD
jgi:hypothetical protein